MELHEPPWTSISLHGGLHGVPGNVGSPQMVNTQRGEDRGSLRAKTAHEYFYDSPPPNCRLHERENEEYLPLQSAKLKEKA